ncbi:MAG: permease [Peptococcaceae bacterium]|jgi:putative transport protein|nr:permease [Peptococcaceae bacterium]
MTTLMILFLILVLGYLLGRITVKGLGLGSSGVLLVSLVFGHFGFEAAPLVRDLGLALFVTAVGFIAGPVFFRNFKKEAMNYIILGVLIIVVGAATCVAAMVLLRIPTPLAVGIMAGALTTTPGLAAAIEASGSDMVSVGYGVAYPFGVVGVVLFVQLMPKLLKMDIRSEARQMDQALNQAKSEKGSGKTFMELDDYGFCAFALAVVLGLLIGRITVPLPGGASFSLSTSGGPLLSGLILGHFGHLGPISVTAPAATLKPMREFGLVLFLMGAGTNAGKGFIAVLQEYGVQLFIVGIFITLLPMIVGYILARGPMRMPILNTLGSICGGMTSTPALGTLISVARTDAVAASYAATYPVALIFVVLFCQFIVLFF